MFQTNVLEKSKTHILCSKLFFPEYPAGYEIIWKNIVEPDRKQIFTIWRMYIACWAPKSRYIHSEYTILLLFHCKNICKQAPQCYVIFKLVV